MSLDIEDMFIILCFLNLCKMYKNLKQKKRRRIRRWSVRPINIDWNISGYHRKVFEQKKKKDEEQFFIHTRRLVKLLISYCL